MKLHFLGYVTISLWAVFPSTVSAKKIRGQTRRFLAPKASKANKEPYLSCGIKGPKCLPDGNICYEKLPESITLSDAIDVCASCCSDTLKGDETRLYCGGFPDGTLCYREKTKPDMCDLCINAAVEDNEFGDGTPYGQKYCGGFPDGHRCAEEESKGDKERFNVCEKCLNPEVQVTTSRFDRQYCGGLPDGLKCYDDSASESEDVQEDTCVRCQNSAVEPYDGLKYCGGLPDGFECAETTMVDGLVFDYCDLCLSGTSYGFPIEWCGEDD